MLRRTRFARQVIVAQYINICHASLLAYLFKDGRRKHFGAKNCANAFASDLSNQGNNILGGGFFKRCWLNRADDLPTILTSKIGVCIVICDEFSALNRQSSSRDFCRVIKTPDLGDKRLIIGVIRIGVSRVNMHKRVEDDRCIINCHWWIRPEMGIGFAA